MNITDVIIVIRDVVFNYYILQFVLLYITLVCFYREREEEAKREKARQEAERRRQEELEREMQRQRELEAQREQERKRQEEMKEQARKYVTLST